MRAMGKLLLLYGTLAAAALAALAVTGNLDRLAPARGLAGAADLAVGLGTGIALAAASRLALGGERGARFLTEEFRARAGALSPRQALTAAVLAGVAEELLFRGVLQPLAGLWVASALFGAVHLGPGWRSLPWAAMAFAAGVVLGGLFEWTGHLVAPAAAHATVNYLNLRRFGAGAV